MGFIKLDLMSGSISVLSSTALSAGLANLSRGRSVDAKINILHKPNANLLPINQVYPPETMNPLPDPLPRQTWHMHAILSSLIPSTGISTLQDVIVKHTGHSSLQSQMDKYNKIWDYSTRSLHNSLSIAYTMKQRFPSLQSLKKLQTTNLAMHSDNIKNFSVCCFLRWLDSIGLCAADFSFLYNIIDPASPPFTVLILSWYYTSSSTSQQMCLEKPASTRPRFLLSPHSTSFILCSQAFPETMNMKQ